LDIGVIDLATMKIFSIFLFAFILSACSNTPEASIDLDFESTHSNLSSQLVQSNFDVVQESTIHGYKVILFKTEKDSDIQGGIYVNDKLYSIGPVSMSMSTDDMLFLTESNVFGKEIIRYSGVLGANYARSVYVEVINDVVSPLIEVDGNIVETDLDHDGVNEVITSIGTISETSIYRIHNNSIHVANVNQSLQAEAVDYIVEKNIFEVYFAPQNSSIYLYIDGNMVHVKPVQSIMQ
jgi:hypothetical protein